MFYLEVNDVHTVVLLLEDILLHGGLRVIRTNVRGGSQHLGDVIFLQMSLIIEKFLELKSAFIKICLISYIRLASFVDQTAFPINWIIILNINYIPNYKKY